MSESKPLVDIMHVVERVIEDVALRLHELNHFPDRLYSQHTLLSKWIELPSPHKRNLLQLEFVIAIVSRLTIATPAHSREMGAITKAVVVLHSVHVADLKYVLRHPLQLVLVYTKCRYDPGKTTNKGLPC